MTMHSAAIWNPFS